MSGNRSQPSADSSAGTQWRELRCGWAWWDWLVLRVVIQSHDNRREGADMFYMWSQHLLYICKISTAVHPDTNLGSGWTEQSLSLWFFSNSAMYRLLIAGKRPGGPSQKRWSWAWSHRSAKLTLPLWVTTKRLEDASLTLEVSACIFFFII